MGEGKGACCREGRLVHGRRQRELERERPEDGAQDLRYAVARVSLLAQTVVGGIRVSNSQRPARRQYQHARARAAFSSASSSSAFRRPKKQRGRREGEEESPSSHDERRRDGRVEVASADACGGVDEHHKGQPIADGRRRKPCTREQRPRAGLVIAPGIAAQGKAGARGGGTCGNGVSIGAAADELEEEDADKLGYHAVDGDLACVLKGGSG